MCLPRNLTSKARPWLSKRKHQSAHKVDRIPTPAQCPSQKVHNQICTVYFCQETLPAKLGGKKNIWEKSWKSWKDHVCADKVSSSNSLCPRSLFLEISHRDLKHWQLWEFSSMSMFHAHGSILKKRRFEPVQKNTWLMSRSKTTRRMLYIHVFFFFTIHFFVYIYSIYTHIVRYVLIFLQL